MKVLVSPIWTEPPLAELRAAFPAVQFATATTPEAPAAVADADAVFGWLSRDAFLAARRLRWIQSWSAGVEWVARVPELVASDVVVTNTRGAHAQTIAETAFAHLLFLTRGLRKLDAAQRERRWQHPGRGELVGLSGLTLGVLGLGKIGGAIARRAAAFDMRVIAVDAQPIARPDCVAELGGLEQLPDLLRQSDVLVVAAPITPESRGMLGAAQLALLKPSAYVVVVSRGGIVDEQVLAGMLKEGRLAGAGLDATAPEPLPQDSPLWDLPNVIISPHCSAQSEQTLTLVWSIFRENLARFLAGEPLQNLVDKRRGY